MSRMEPKDGGGGPEAKRKKSYSRREILEKLEECENDVKRAVNEIEIKVEKLEQVSKNLATKVYKLKKAAQLRKFRHNPELLEEKFFSSSQYSILQSEDSEELSQTLSQASLHDETERPETYRFKNT